MEMKEFPMKQFKCLLILKLNDEISNKKINLILKDLYETNYFEDVKVSFKNKILTIFVKEHPIIQKYNL